MSIIRRHVLVCAALAGLLAYSPARAGEVQGELVFCCKTKTCNACAPATACYDPCCDPCRVGPIRRFFRGCHRKPCPPPCPRPCGPAFGAAVVVPAPVVPAPPAVIVPPA